MPHESNTALQLEQMLLTRLEEDIARNRLVLPSLPEVALRVRTLLGQPDCSIPGLAQVISTDAGMAARLIKVANSAVYRGKKPIDDIRTAVTRLGMQLVRSLVTQLALLQSMHNYQGETGRQLKAITDHSLEVGARAHALALRYTTLNPEEALLAGLVHDIGKLPLLSRMHELLGARVDTLPTDAILYRLHTRVGGLVLRAWQFAPELVAAAEEHENPQRNPHGAVDCTDLVIVANLQHHLRSDTRHEQSAGSAQAHAFRKLNTTPQALLTDEALESQVALTLERLRV